MSNDKAEILTEAEVAKHMTFPYLLEGGTGERALSTIRQMAGLLERLYFITSRPCRDIEDESELFHANQNAGILLARYKGERT